jgi:integrase
MKRREKALLNVENGSLAVLVEKTHDTLRATLKQRDPTNKWSSPLRTHVLPKLGSTPIMKIDAHDLAQCLQSAWKNTPESGRKALNCLNKVYEYAFANGFDVDISDIKKAKTLLGPLSKSQKNMPAMHWKDVPEFYGSLNNISIDHLALRLLILTGLRTDPIRHLRLEQIEGDVWTVPEEHVKGRVGHTKPFRLPLGPEARAVIKLAKCHEWNGFLFPNSKGKELDRMALIKLMKGFGITARPHGFRSAVRTWISDTTDTAEEVAEACIGHFEADKVVKAYKRTDFFEKRVPIMMDWEKYVISGKS